MKLVGLLLAAGSGHRFGSHKLLAPLPDGTPLAIAAARTLAAALPDSVAVIRHGDGELARRLTAEGLGVLPIRPASDAQGMGDSLAWGVEATAGADGWVIALADMPFIRAESITAIAEAMRDGAPLAAPVYRGRRGHPVAFDRAFRPSLCALYGDAGARSILERHRERMVRVPVDDPGVLVDVDLPADLRVRIP